MDYIKAFIVGGLICAAGQILIDKTKLTPAKILVCFVVAGVVLQAIGAYQPLVDFAGAGATIPLTGFGYTLARGTALNIGEQGLLGALTGPLNAGSAGITAALMCGLIASLFTGPKGK